MSVHRPVLVVPGEEVVGPLVADIHKDRVHSGVQEWSTIPPLEHVNQDEADDE